MKKILFLAAILLVSSLTFAQKIELKAKVDERCELLSVVFRLVEANEYVTHNIPVYVDHVDQYFEAYKEHELIKYCKVFRENYGVGYDAPMSMAVHLQIIDGKISLIPNVKENSLDSRWERSYLPRFIELLNNFYSETRFHDFFISQKDFIEKVEQKATEHFMQVDLEWFENFYGEVPEGSFNLIVSLSNGRNNYGPKVEYNNNKEDLYSITICAVDSLNNPYFGEWALDLVIHEFCHSFCNHLIEENYDKMKKKADEFFKLKKEVLSKQAYPDSKTMLYEILVRASVIKYMADHYPTNPEKYFKSERRNGFIWIEELYNALLKYDKQRDKYPTLRSYMPEIVKVQNKLNPKKMIKEQEKNMPTMSIANIKNGQQNVDAATTTQIIIKFDKKMYTGANGVTYGSKGKEYYPEVTAAYWNEETKQEWILEVKLEPNKEYSLVFPSFWFYAEDGSNPKNSISLDFKTK